MKFIFRSITLVLLGQLFVQSFAQGGFDSIQRTGRAGDTTKKIIIDTSRLPGVKRPDGKRCVKKVVDTKETVYDFGMECHHKLKEKCHLTYVTDYHPTPEEKCETIFKKSCHITFKPVPHTEKVKKCHTPYEKKCGPGIKGKEICKFVYDNNCETKYEEYDVEEDTPVCEIKEVEKCEEKNFQLFHLPLKEGQKPFAKKQLCEKWPVKKCEVQHNNVKKVHPKTECKKESRKVCYPDNCELVPGKEICYEEEVVQIQNIPEEECDLDPHKDCKTVTSLVPRLVPKKNCVKVPKEICVNTKKNPKQVPKKVVKNWCYDPEELRNLD